MFGVVAMQISAAASMLACLSIIIVILRLNLTKRMLFMKLVFYIAICDFFGSLPLVIGGTRSGSAACYYQGIVNNYFTLASIFWTMVIGYEVHLVIWYSRVQMNLTYFGIIVWTLPLFLSLVPISTSTYGNDDGTPGWCFLNGRANAPEWLAAFWYIASFYLWIYIAIFYLIYVTICSAYKLHYLQRGMTTDGYIVVERILYYPLIVVICWVVSSVVDIGDVIGYSIEVRQTNPVLILFAYVLPNLQGFLSGVVFFLFNKQVVDQFFKEVQENGLFLSKVDYISESTNSSFLETNSSSMMSNFPSEQMSRNNNYNNNDNINNNNNGTNRTTTTKNVTRNTRTSIFERFSRQFQQQPPQASPQRPHHARKSTNPKMKLLDHAHMTDGPVPRESNHNSISNNNHYYNTRPTFSENPQRLTQTQQLKRGSLNLFQKSSIQNESSIRESDIEMNRPSSSSFANHERPSIDYAGWDEDLGTESIDTNSMRTSEYSYTSNSVSPRPSNRSDRRILPIQNRVDGSISLTGTTTTAVTRNGIDIRDSENNQSSIVNNPMNQL